MSAVGTAPEIDGLRFLEHLGTGGYSDVFLYERRSPRMKVAVKVLKDGRIAARELEQFAAEAETMAELADHPYIVQVFTTGTTADGRPYLVMKYYPPPNLGVRAARERFSVPDVLRTGVKIASAVETAHRAGILHRDIKPANILTSQYGEPGLADFGIAGHAAEADDAEDLGVSIPWSPPEVLAGTSNGSPQSDVYSLAATIWHLLAGRSPFEIAGGDNSPRALMARVLQLPPPPTGRADVPPSLERLLQHAMAKDPGLRPRTALELARGLQAVEQEQRFSRTEIVVDDPAPVRPPQPQRPDAGDATRMRAPVRPADRGAPEAPVRPKTAPPATGPTRADRNPPGTEPPTTSRPAVPSGSGGARARAALPQDAPDSTVLRPATATPTDTTTDQAPPRRGLKRSQVGIIGAALVVAAVVVGIVISSGGSAGHEQGGTVPTQPATEDVLGPAAALAAPQVTATYDATHKLVRFSWSSPSDRVGSYAWWPAGNPAQQTRTDDTAVQVRLPAGATAAGTCIQVVAIPVDGGSPSEPSAPVCGG